MVSATSIGLNEPTPGFRAIIREMMKCGGWRNEETHAYRRTIARRAGFSIRTVSRCIAWMKQRGAIVSMRRNGPYAANYELDAHLIRALLKPRRRRRSRSQNGPSLSGRTRRPLSIEGEESRVQRQAQHQEHRHGANTMDGADGASRAPDEPDCTRIVKADLTSLPRLCALHRQLVYRGLTVGARSSDTLRDLVALAKKAVRIGRDPARLFGKCFWHFRDAVEWIPDVDESAAVEWMKSERNCRTARDPRRKCAPLSDDGRKVAACIAASKRVPAHDPYRDRPAAIATTHLGWTPERWARAWSEYVAHRNGPSVTELDGR